LRKLPIAEQISVGDEVRIQEGAHDISPRVDCARVKGDRGIGDVDTREDPFVQQETVAGSVDIVVPSDDVFPSVDSEGNRGCRAWKVDFHEMDVSR
jgi:hypothetical protein